MDKYLNVDYRVVVERRNAEGVREFRRLFGRYGLISLLGRDTYLRVVKQAYARNSVKYSCTPRKGMIITFYLK